VTTAADIVAEAEAWLGTPFHWQASLKGVGCDCKGLIWGVARELGLPEAASLYAQIADYGARVPVETLLAGLQATLTRTAFAQPGDVLLFRMAGRPQHLGLHAGDRVIHTYNGGPRRVISTHLAAPARPWPLHSAWRFGSLEA
jgi:NlpC/P60 family putative phage cell wall peptidase